MEKEHFGHFFRACRLRQGTPLRLFCRANGFDAANISKLERGLMPPPTSTEKLEQYARALGIAEGSDDWYEFFDLAATDVGRLPGYLLNDQELLLKLPLVFRTLRGDKVSGAQLDELMERMRKA